MTAGAARVPMYVDSSVVVVGRLVGDARRAPALRWLGRHRQQLVTSAIAQVEVGRALERRCPGASTLRAPHEILSGIALAEIAPAIRAGDRPLFGSDKRPYR